MKKMLNISYFFFLGILLLPLLQKQIIIVKEEPLDGEYQLKNQPKFSIESFMSGSYQSEFEDYLKDRIGMHATLIRLRNQFNYSLLRDVNTYGVKMGKGEMMFPRSYIETYFGQDYIGASEVSKFVNELKKVQDGLEEKGIQFMVLLAPGKSSIYPERIPEEFVPDYFDGVSNYSELIKQSEKQGINLLDCRSYLFELKSKIESQVFPNYSVHWSGNTVSYVSDTLMEYLNRKFDLDLPKIKRKKGYYTLKEYKYTDYDIGESMNLLWHAATDSLYYPEIEFQGLKKKEERPKLLACGDSFFQSFYGFYPILDSCFSSDSKFYYYNRMVAWPSQFDGLELSTSLLDLSIELKDKDIVILEMTDENIKKIGFGFTDELIDIVYNKPLTNHQIERINEEMQKAELIDKAKYYYEKAGYTFEEMKYSIAKKIVLDETLLSNEEYQRLIEEKINAIYNTPEWLKKVKDQAAAEGITVEENTYKNAKWVVDQEYRK